MMRSAGPVYVLDFHPLKLGAFLHYNKLFLIKHWQSIVSGLAVLPKFNKVNLLALIGSE